MDIPLGVPDTPWFPTPTSQISGGPDRVVTDQPDPQFKRRPVGFVIKEEE